MGLDLDAQVQGPAQPLAGLVGIPSRMRQQVSRCDHLMPLTRRQRDVDRPRFRVDDDVKLC